VLAHIPRCPAAVHGHTAQAVIARAETDRRTVLTIADTLHGVAQQARLGAADIDNARTAALESIDRAESIGLMVNDDLSVYWDSTGNQFADAILESKAQTHADEIWTRARALSSIDTAVANGLTRALGLGDLPAAPEPTHDGSGAQLIGKSWSAVQLPPAPPGKEWHYYWNWGWVLEEPLRDCDSSDEFWNLLLVGGGAVSSIFGGPVGFFTGIPTAGAAANELNQCKGPGT
jgi:hypothetical protein